MLSSAIVFSRYLCARAGATRPDKEQQVSKASKRLLFAQIWRESTANTHCVQQKSTIRYPVADKIMNLTPPTLASETSLNERNRPA